MQYLLHTDLAGLTRTRFHRVLGRALSAMLFVLPGFNSAAECLPSDNVRLPTTLEVRVPKVGVQRLFHDGNALYSDGVQGVVAYVLDEHFVKTCPSITTPNCQRSMTLDLSAPVTGTAPLGATPLPLDPIRDFNAHLFATWKLDANNVWQSVQDIPVKTTVISDYTALMFRVNGVRHFLVFGDRLPFGSCLNSFTPIPGSRTAVSITRVSKSEWTVISPSGAQGKLINYANETNPTVVGEYYFDFSVSIKVKTKGKQYRLRPICAATPPPSADRDTDPLAARAAPGPPIGTRLHRRAIPGRRCAVLLAP